MSAPRTGRNLSSLNPDVLNVVATHLSSISDLCVWAQEASKLAKDPFNRVETLLVVAQESARKMRQLSSTFNLCQVEQAIDMALSHIKCTSHSPASESARLKSDENIASVLRIAIRDVCKRAQPYIGVLRLMMELDSKEHAPSPLDTAGYEATAHSAYRIDDSSFVAYVLSHCPYAFEHARDRERNDALIVNAVVRQVGLLLRYASLSRRGDFNTVLAAVGNDGRALTFALGDMRRNPTVVLAAVKQNPMAWRCAEPSRLLEARKDGRIRDRLCAFLLVSMHGKAHDGDYKELLERQYTVADRIKAHLDAECMQTHLVRSVVLLSTDEYWHADVKVCDHCNMFTCFLSMKSAFDRVKENVALSDYVDEWCNRVVSEFFGRCSGMRAMNMYDFKVYLQGSMAPIAFGDLSDSLAEIRDIL